MSRTWRLLAATLALSLHVVSAIATDATLSTTPTNGRHHHLRHEDIDSDVRRLTVFGADDRRAVSDVSLYPYSAVGLLRWNAKHICTASLISAKYAVTAAECVFNSDGTRRTSTLPEPELVVGAGSTAPTTAHVVNLHRQSSFWKNWTQETYVILELDAQVGDTHGTLLLPHAGDLDESLGKTAVQMVGFDDDAQTASTTALKFSKCTCYFPTTFGGQQYMFHHDCDTSTIGSPGSVLLVRYTSMETYIIGIHTNVIGDNALKQETDGTLDGYSDAVANRGVLGPFIQQHLQSLLVDDADASGSGSKSTTTAPQTTPPPQNSTHSRASDNEVGQDSREADPGTESASTSRPALAESTAYTCIVFVGCAWLCIIFIAVRNMRAPKRRQEQ